MKKVTAWLCALLWMGVIFMMSALPGDVSGAQSGRVMQLVLSCVSFVFGSDAAARILPETLHLLLRKGAHMAEYAVLFLLYYRALRISGARRPGVTALCLCACYAATDEGHQAFVADRGPSVIDVGVDTLGAAMAWGMQRMAQKISGKGSGI